MWDFSREKGKNNIDKYKQIYEDNGGEVLFIELMAPLEIRAERADSPLRKSLKAHAPNKDRVVHLENVLDYKSPTPFFYS